MSNSFSEDHYMAKLILKGEVLQETLSPSDRKILNNYVEYLKLEINKLKKDLNKNEQY